MPIPYFTKGNKMKTNIVTVSTPGHILVFRGKRIRTPVRFEKVTKEELALLENQCRRSLLKYEIYKEIPEEKKERIDEEEIYVEETVPDESDELLSEEGKGSILDRLASDLE